MSAVVTRTGRMRLRSVPGIARPVRSVVLVLLVVIGLAGCGGSDPQRNATSDDVGQVETVDFVAGAPLEVREVSVVLGKIVFLTVSSDVPGEIRIDGYNVAGPVEPGTPASLVISADKPGVFDVNLSRDGENLAIAQLDVQG